jgi:recombination protein RecA
MAVDYDIVNKSGSWFTYDKERLGQGREAAKEFLAQNPDLRDEIDHLVRVEVGLVDGEPVADDGMGILGEGDDTLE